MSLKNAISYIIIESSQFMAVHEKTFTYERSFEEKRWTKRFLAIHTHRRFPSHSHTALTHLKEPFKCFTVLWNQFNRNHVLLSIEIKSLRFMRRKSRVEMWKFSPFFFIFRNLREPQWINASSHLTIMRAWP